MKKLPFTAILSTLLVLTLLIIPSVSALEFDNVKDVVAIKNPNYATIGDRNLEWNDLWNKYPVVKVENGWGLDIPYIYRGKKLFEIGLTEHSEVCEGDYCYSKGVFYTSGDDPVYSSMDFYTKVDDEWVKQNVRSWSFKYWGQVDDYEWQCSDTGKVSLNGTKIQECSNVKVGSHEDWIRLNAGEKLPEGTYDYFLEAKKKPSREVDWVMTSNGKALNELAVWGSQYIWNNGSAHSTYDPNSMTNPENFFDEDEGTYAEYTEIAGTGGETTKSLGKTFSATYVNETYIKTRIGFCSDGNNNGYADGWLETYDGTTWNEVSHFVDEGSTGNTCYNYDTNQNFTIQDTIQGIRIRSRSRSFGSTDYTIKYYTLEYSVAGEAYINLNSPINEYISDTPEVTFNATATVTGGATLVNMSLWTNETGSWAIENTTEVVSSGAGQVAGGTNFYKFDETTGTVAYDYLGNDDSSISGTVTINVEGKSARAYNFSNGYITPGALTTTDFSVSAWVNREAGARTIWAQGGAFLNIETDGSILCVIDDGGGNNVADSVSAIPLETWTHIGCSYDKTGSGDIILYINGQLNDTTGSTRTPSGGGARIGQRSTGANPFKGRIDEVGLWDSEISAANFQTLYNSANPTSSSTQTWSKTIPSGTTLWNVQACDTDGDCGFATSNYTVSLDATAPSVTTIYPSGLINTLVEGQTLALNYSISDTNLDACWYSYNGTNTTIGNCSANTNFTYSFGKNNLTLYANDSVGNTNSSFTSWSAKIIENSQTFSATTVEGSIESFYANMTLAEGIEISSATLIYNGESETASIDSSGTIRILGVTGFEIPSQSVETNISFYWSLVLDDASIINLTARNQTVTTINLDNCSSYSFQLFNLSLYDEELLTPVLGTIQLYYEILNVPNYNTVQNYSGEFTNVSNTLVCSEANLSGQNLVY